MTNAVNGSTQTGQCDFLRTVAQQASKSVGQIQEAIELLEQHALEAVEKQNPDEKEQTAPYLLSEILKELRSITAFLSVRTQLRGYGSKVLSGESKKIKGRGEVPFVLDSLESHQPTLERAFHNLHNAVLKHECQRP